MGDGHGGCSRGMFTGDGYGRWSREMVTGDGYGNSLFSSFWGMVPGVVYGKSLLSSVSFNFSNFLLLGDGYGRWVQEMVTGSLCIPLFLF